MCNVTLNYIYSLFIFRYEVMIVNEQALKAGGNKFMKLYFGLSMTSKTLPKPYLLISKQTSFCATVAIKQFCMWKRIIICQRLTQQRRREWFCALGCQWQNQSAIATLCTYGTTTRNFEIYLNGQNTCWNTDWVLTGYWLVLTRVL